MTRHTWLGWVIAAQSTLLLGGTASHAVRPAKSLYTALDRTHCSAVDPATDGRQLRCQGLPGYPVYLSEADLRAFVSVGANAETRKAATQTLAASNSIFPGATQRATLEWRFVIRDEKPAPYALILRYFTVRDNRRGQVLVVTRVTDTEACHVAYIDALANPNAIILARRIADERARKFDCKGTPVRIGAAGLSPM
ncbi:MAG: hypothetical protein ACT4N2_02080 [Hyphomicrobium sp.]